VDCPELLQETNEQLRREPVGVTGFICHVEEGGHILDALPEKKKSEVKTFIYSALV
jgi:hypothetical protein